MDYLKTASGKQMPCDFCSRINTWQGPHLILRVRIPMADAASIFADPEETKQLWFGPQYYAGFTRLTLIVQEPEEIRVELDMEV